MAATSESGDGPMPSSTHYVVKFTDAKQYRKFVSATQLGRKLSEDTAMSLQRFGGNANGQKVKIEITNENASSEHRKTHQGYTIGFGIRDLRYNEDGSIVTSQSDMAKGADDLADAIYKAIADDMENGCYEATITPKYAPEFLNEHIVEYQFCVIVEKLADE